MSQKSFWMSKISIFIWNKDNDGKSKDQKRNEKAKLFDILRRKAFDDLVFLTCLIISISLSRCERRSLLVHIIPYISVLFDSVFKIQTVDGSLLSIGELMSTQRIAGRESNCKCLYDHLVDNPVTMISTVLPSQTRLAVVFNLRHL